MLKTFWLKNRFRASLKLRRIEVRKNTFRHTPWLRRFTIDNNKNDFKPIINNENFDKIKSKIFSIDKMYKNTQFLSENPQKSGGFKKILGAVFNFVLSFAGFILGIFLYSMYYTYKNPRTIKTSFFEEITPRDAINRKLPSFDEVCGNEEVKEELLDIIVALKNQKLFAKMKVDLPKGVLITGDPGCGKTLMAKALAGEAGVAFINCPGPSFEQMLVGVGAKRVRKLFARAREIAPCIIFIDEIDALTERRNVLTSKNRSTINQLLSEMDGFHPSSGVIVIAASNRADNLDSALTRSGRFDRKVNVSLPDRVTREKMFVMFLRKMSIDRSVSVKDLAAESTGFSGADISNIVNTAANETIKRGAPKLSMADLRAAIAIISLGRPRRNLAVDAAFRRATAFHEAGHTTAALFGARPVAVSQVTILPRGASLGATHQVAADDAQFQLTRGELAAQLDVAMGGFVAEERLGGRAGVTSGAAGDFRKATELALRMATEFGMGAAMGRLSLGAGSVGELPPEWQRRVGAEVTGLLDEAYERCKAVIEENKAVFERIAEELMLKETLSKEDLDKLVRESRGGGGK